MRTVLLGGTKAAGRVSLVDDEDYELVLPYHWHVDERTHPSGRIEGPYAVAHIIRDGRPTKIRMHTLITGWVKTDHVNHNGLDNQRENLRPATTAQNNHNQRPRADHSSRYKGVTWHRKVGKWQATIKVNDKGRYLGIYSSEEEAALAYNAAALEAYGEYAYLNEVTAA